MVDGEFAYPLIAIPLLLMPLGAFAALAFALGSDFYACEVLQRPNCD
jgi:hypothetical protein